MDSICLDQNQCDHFALPDTDLYYGPAGTELIIAASTLLRSKGGDGYDEEHRAILEPLGSKTLVLVRGETDGPGWFGIQKVVG